MLHCGRSIGGVGTPAPNEVVDENLRTEMLLDAQDKAAQLFTEIERSGMIRAGVGEKELSDEIRDLAAEMFGVERHWHKRIVRAGENTLQPYRKNPPDRPIAEDDIVFCDFGPIFDRWEADFGRTFVLGDDPRKRALRDDLPRVWANGRDYFDSHPDVTGAELFDHVVALSRDAGWEFGGTIAGHLVGEFPHEKIAGDAIESYIAPGSDNPMRRTDRTGRICHWILEVHLTDPARRFGGFHEELLDIRR
jgi:Xaa-Pro dipeptidase